ncbi:MAG: MarR family transcriptional regulator [Rhizobiales bacterium]|nr:MarR family transcriptional regulator [Hyphomicrobiales bacterium]
MSSQEPVAPSEGAAKPRRRDRTAPVDPKNALEDALLSAHRIAVAIGEINAFRDANVSLAEWGILRTIGARKDVSLKEVSVAAGVSRQRVRKVLSDLQAKDLVTMGKSEGTDKRMRTISATPATARVLASVSQQMHGLLSQTGQGQQSRRLAGAARSLNRLAKHVRRSLAAGRPGRKKKADAASDLDED